MAQPGRKTGVAHHLEANNAAMTSRNAELQASKFDDTLKRTNTDSNG